MEHEEEKEALEDQPFDPLDHLEEEALEDQPFDPLDHLGKDPPLEEDRLVESLPYGYGGAYSAEGHRYLSPVG